MRGKSLATSQRAWGQNRETAVDHGGTVASTRPMLARAGQACEHVPGPVSLLAQQRLQRRPGHVLDHGDVGRVVFPAGVGQVYPRRADAEGGQALLCSQEQRQPRRGRERITGTAGTTRRGRPVVRCVLNVRLSVLGKGHGAELYGIVNGPADALSLPIARRVDAQARAPVRDVRCWHEVHLSGVRTVDSEVIDIAAVRAILAPPAPNRRGGNIPPL